MVNNFDVERTGLVFTLTAGNLPVKTFAVVDFILDEALSTLFSLHVTLTCIEPDIDFAEVLDKYATLTVYRDGQPERYITGIVTHFVQETASRYRSGYSLTLHPSLWRAGLRVNSRIFQHQSVTDIIDRLLKENGVRQFSCCLRYEHPVREFCVQYDESDLAFLQRLLADEGIFYYYHFNQDKSEPTMVFVDSYAENGSLSLPYNPELDATGSQCCISRFRWEEKVGIAEVSVRDYTFKHPRWFADFQFHENYRYIGNQRSDLPSYYYYDFPGRYKDKNGQRISQYRLEALRNDVLLGNGHSDSFALLPGRWFKLTDHPKEKFNTSWQIIQITHQGHQPQADESRFGGRGTTLTNHFTFGSPNRVWRPSPYPKPRIDGLQIATVVGPEGEEIFCDEYGRVRVQFAWDRYGELNDQSSCWIRVSQSWAGHCWGMMTIPRVGQEVLVDFLHGDPDQPIIIGRTYNAINLPPNRLPMAKTQMVIRSKTHKGEGFNELRFDDDKGGEEIYIHAQKNMKTEILNDEMVNIAHNQTHHIKHDAHLRVDNEYRVLAQQDISVSTGQKLHIKADDALLVQSGNEIHLSSGAKVVIDAGSELTLQAAGHFIKIDVGGISSSAGINFASGTPGTGSGWGGKLPDMLDKLEQVSAEISTPVSQEPLKEICLSCLMKAELEEAITVIRG
ncbi:type VI secretion system tip protein TssI/VgrG [Photorhabdus laumondii]|uniref:Type VI secretion system tip protein VgrG n=1 Tax=Photorhabdus laumondii subsp. clarkei TaxID=2029685 RepID=A0A329VBT6_9GAMM|nr:type VI secretion system tip protein TssI/VgrG [Photorhabdus laumondii]RAW84996.1 type VI secretion system tip protein VgrG [Photorhabdus laumondii subsp. clarkei]